MQNQIKYSINITIPYAVTCDPIVNKIGGGVYNKRLTKEFRDLQEFCSRFSIYISDNKKTEQQLGPLLIGNDRTVLSNGKYSELIYKNLWINLKPNYTKCSILETVNILIYRVFELQTPSQYKFEMTEPPFNIVEKSQQAEKPVIPVRKSWNNHLDSLNDLTV